MFLFYIIIIGVLLICEVISNYLFIYYASWLGQSVVKDIRVKLFDHILDFKMKYYDKSSVGILITRTVTDMERIADIFGQGFSGKKTQLGVKMSTAVKAVGCSNLKALLEEDKLIIKDYDTISELTTFIVKGQSFAAEDGCNDDLAMCLVIFSLGFVSLAMSYSSMS